SFGSSGSHKQEKRTRQYQLLDVARFERRFVYAEGIEDAHTFHGLSAPLSPSSETSLGHFSEGSMRKRRKNVHFLQNRRGRDPQQYRA
ncbi:hypothetical protein, partial [Nitratifractor sp.]|uniref:hypothetical protein n=1 Tax=Nitratifractor sp. TaxID=2268144 RepID=UPI0025E4D008